VPSELAGLPSAVIYPLAFVFGALWGSFLNVCIARIPAGRSVVRPSSRCPHCDSAIRPYDNIPIVSYLFLRGRCRSCGARFSPRYLVVELLMGILSVALLHRFGLSWSFLAYFIFSAGLLVAAFVDLAHLIIPNEVTFLLVAVGLGMALVPGATVRPLDAAIGAAAGGGGLALVALVYRWVRRMTGLGFGDVKLLAAIGAFLGWRALPLVLFLSAVQGLLGAIGFWVARRRKAPVAAPPVPAVADAHDGPPPGRLAVPFGPFLALGSLEVLFFGPLLARVLFGFAL
jgi:leader peptidase (prepilin peptidase)/N-methyltransferase